MFYFILRPFGVVILKSVSICRVNMSLDWNYLDSDFLDLKGLESQLVDFVDRSSIEENIKTQLAEFEMIQSMFSNPGELVIDVAMIADLQEYADGRGTSLPLQLDFTINLTLDSHKFQVSVSLPLEYPTIEPDLFARSDSLGRVEQHTLNEDLSCYISSLPRGEICIYSGITWLQDNAVKYIDVKKSPPTRKKADNSVGNFSRLWIHSHHIYSKSKRRELLDLAQEFNLTGFSLPGRPGIICFEGSEEDCEDCWYKVKSMNWKKIVCVKKEIEKLGVDGKVLTDCRRFQTFKEISFEGGKVRGREYNMDFGEFYKYLSDNGCEYAFKMFFGVDGKVSTVH